ncbi:MAG: d(CMP) kinase [Pseudomonadota bacterium]
MQFTVAIDGPAAAGKGTIARAVAAYFKFAHLDSGLLYRVVGKKMIEGADPIQAALSLIPNDLNADGLRTAQVAQAASQVAKIPEVRTAFLEFQRRFARQTGGAVIDGRDIGTVICPRAEVKLYVTASPMVRANRRYKELAPNTPGLTHDTVLADVIARDKADRERAASPLMQADDAIVIDTSDLSIEDAVARSIDHVKTVFNGPLL